MSSIVIIRIGRSDAQLVVSLEAPDDCGRFHLELPSSGSLTQLDALLKERLVGEIEDETTAFVDPRALRDLAVGRVGQDWPERFSAMLDFAARQGWTREDGYIQAHVERR